MKNEIKNFKKKESKQFSITMDSEVVERIYHIKKISNVKGFDAYKSLSSYILEWIESKEKILKIDKSDHKTASICPMCASKLRVCEGSSVKFIGCSSYPKCKYTRSI